MGVRRYWKHAENTFVSCLILYENYCISNFFLIHDTVLRGQNIMKMGITLRNMFKNNISIRHKYIWQRFTCIELEKSYLNDMLALSLQMFLCSLITIKFSNVSYLGVNIWSGDEDRRKETCSHLLSTEAIYIDIEVSIRTIIGIRRVYLKIK